MKNNDETDEKVKPISRFVIDLSVNGSTHSLEGPSVTRNATNDLRIIGSSIMNPHADEIQAEDNSTELITSSDNNRGVAEVSRSAREHFMRTISRLKHESKSSLAYLEQLQSASEDNQSPSLPHQMLSETEEMNLRGDLESPGFQSSYFFPNSLKPVTSHSIHNDTFDISSHQDIPSHSIYRLKLDSESGFEQSYSYTPASKRVNMDLKFGGSQVEMSSFTPLTQMRKMSSSFPDFSFSPAQTEKQYYPTLRTIQRSRSDPYSFQEMESDLSSNYRTLRRVQSSPKIDFLFDVDTDINLGYTSTNDVQEHGFEQIEKHHLEQTTGVTELSTIGIDTSHFFEPPGSENPANINSPIQEETQDPDPKDSVKMVAIELNESEEISITTDGSTSLNGSEERLISHPLIVDVVERVRNVVEPPLLTENEPEKSHAFQRRGIHLVDNMWNDFSFSKYAIPTPKARKPLRTTIPQPFSVYYKSLQPKKKTRAQIEGEVKRRQEMESEEVECSKQFIAQPIPNSTFQHIYQHIVSKEEKRREQNRIDSKETLKSIVKPFNFEEREAEKRAENKAKFLSQRKNVVKSKFKAKPVPKHLFQSRYDDEVAEQDLYREIRKVMRTNQLLSHSKLPSSMSESDHAFSYTDGRRRLAREEENSKQAFLTSEHSFRPTVNKHMPDFRRQHKLFEQKMSERKESQRLTRIEFSELELNLDDLDTAKGSKIGVLYPGGREVLKICSSTSQAKKRPSNPPPADGIYGHAPTKSTRLRQTLVNKRLTEQAQKERDERDRAKQQNERVRKMEREVAERVKRYDNSEEMARRAEEKKRNFRETESSRKEQYTEHLRMIKEKLDERPLVFERPPLETAKRITSKSYNSILTSSGVTDKQISVLDETFTKSYLVQPNVLSIS